MKTNQHTITDQNITQMISSYFIRNRKLLYSLREQVACEPVPLIPRRDLAPLLQGANR